MEPLIIISIACMMAYFLIIAPTQRSRKKSREEEQKRQEEKRKQERVQQVTKRYEEFDKANKLAGNKLCVQCWPNVGLQDCDVCHGDGEELKMNSDYEYKSRTCPKCHGTGTINCRFCMGTGRIR